MRYFDATALAKRYLREPGSEEVAERLEHPAATSRLSAVEVASALTRHARENRFSEQDRDRALRALAHDIAEILVVELDTEVTSLATQLLARHPLRSSDAIHLASCLTLRFELGADIPFVAFDTRLQAAARSEGLLVAP